MEKVGWGGGMEECGEVMLEREEGGKGRGGGGGSDERGGEGGGGEGRGGGMQVVVQREESNVSVPTAQSMRGLWRLSHGNPSTIWKWPSRVT